MLRLFYIARLFLFAMTLSSLQIVCLFAFGEASSVTEANRRALKIISEAENVKQSFKQSEDIK